MKDIFDLIILLIILLINLFILMSFIGFFFSTGAGAPFVPTGKKIAQKMIELANIKSGEKVYDLGCGDGRLVFAAAEQGADAVGVEISLPVYWWARFLQKIGKKKGTIRHGSMWNTDISDADVVFLYLFPKMVERFQTELFPKLKSGARVIAHGFAMKQHEPVQVWRPEGKKRGKLLVYVKT